MSKHIPAPDRPVMSGPRVEDHRGQPTSGAARPSWNRAARTLAVVSATLVAVTLVMPRLIDDGGTAEANTTTTVHQAAEDHPGADRVGVAPSPGGQVMSRGTDHPEVPEKGTGKTKILSVPGQDSSHGGKTYRYTVEAEEEAGVDEQEFTRIVREVLTDRRGWETQDDVHFVNVSPEHAEDGEHIDFRITLASPQTVDQMCAPMTTEGQVSCRNGDRVALNTRRWTEGVQFYPDDVAHYRIYMINHEVGHAIGHGHQTCPGAGQQAPVMLQQTLGLQGCQAYPWAVPGQPM
ncbi:hypothetical protein KEM60_00695 [Austwickia sp. TVS 96-490-7B]|uniref:DUF3152 domain-containing protein n=1 Tax=Austwickia sp. TVS 96-490-7B TaxID=2830843 RepID=UPI001DD33138|nr:DUF3152 domain-containing protein [Austwickia sp. TVS 96-490-7B]MBW3084507.1 hypothetical protein [Austwickia sp. TVS 96-490-7B]